MFPLQGWDIISRVKELLET